MIIMNMGASSHEVHSREASHMKGKAQLLACVAVKYISKDKTSSRPTFRIQPPPPLAGNAYLQATSLEGSKAESPTNVIAN